eukprot:gb/GFBE01061842.1/.p1 GENE.gb/GFBE01061842.1/~~gb/GFBE01061842.1/.p1  ORF type:complete len:122 (+),score=27.77 gb/GFBE01061842.1/:1-366(+)
MTCKSMLAIFVLLMNVPAVTSQFTTNTKFFDCMSTCEVLGQTGSDWCSMGTPTETCERIKCESAKCIAHCGKVAGCLEDVQISCEHMKGMAETTVCDANCDAAGTMTLAPALLGLAILLAW